MTLPSDGLSVLWYALLVVPGAVFVGARTIFDGIRDGDRSVSSKLFAAFLASVFFDLVYVASLSSLVDQRGEELLDLVQASLPVVALLGIVLGFLIPFVSGWLIYGRPPFLRWATRPLTTLRSWLSGSRRARFATAWDAAALGTPNGFVRIRIAPDVWVGGRWSDRSYFSTYPEPRDIFIEEQYHVSSDGTFGSPVAGSAGMWVNVDDSYVVEWLEGEEKNE